MPKGKTRSSRSRGNGRRPADKPAKPAVQAPPEHRWEVFGKSYVVCRDDCSFGESFPVVDAVCDSHDSAMEVMAEFAREESKRLGLNIESGWREDSVRLAADDKYDTVLFNVSEVPRVRIRRRDEGR